MYIVHTFLNDFLRHFISDQTCFILYLHRQTDIPKEKFNDSAISDHFINTQTYTVQSSESVYRQLHVNVMRNRVRT